MAPDELDDLTVDELLEIATDLDITGRHDMRKQELMYAINQSREDETPGGSTEEEAEQQLEEPDDEEESDEEVDDEPDEPLTDEELPWDVAEAEVGDEVQMNHLSRPLTITAINSGNPHEVEMTTNRGGKHMLRVPRDSEPRLMRWRSGDEEWMYNATYPDRFDLPESEEFILQTDKKIPLSVADNEDEAANMAVMQIDAGELDVEPTDVEETDDNWIIMLRGTGKVTGFDPSPEELDTGDF